MNEIEAWKATGRRALRIAEQRGLTSGRVKLAAAGAGILTLTAVLAPYHPMGIQSPRGPHVWTHSMQRPAFKLNDAVLQRRYAELQAQQARLQALQDQRRSMPAAGSWQDRRRVERELDSIEDRLEDVQEDLERVQRELNRRGLPIPGNAPAPPVAPAAPAAPQAPAPPAAPPTDGVASASG